MPSSIPNTGIPSRPCKLSAPLESRWSPKVLYFALVGLGLLARVLVCLRPITCLDGLTIPDDSYYTLTIARSIAQGIGPHAGLAATNGFQPLFGFLMVPFYWLFGDPFSPVRAALFVGALADTAALALFGSLLLKRVKELRVVWLAMLIWALSPYSIKNATNGLETSLALLLVLATAAYFPRLRLQSSGVREFAVFGVLGGFALFARIDSGLLLASAAILAAPTVFARGIKTAIKLGAATLGAVLAVNLPWWIFSYHYTDRVYPDSGRAVRLISHINVLKPTLSNVYLPEFIEGYHAIRDNQRPALAILLLAVIVLLWRGRAASLVEWLRSLWRQEGVLILFVILLFFAYTTYIFGYWFFLRYFYVTSAVILLAMALALDKALGLLAEPRWRVAVLLGSITLYFATVLIRHEQRKIDTDGPHTLAGLYLTAEPQRRAYMNIGLWANQHLPAGAVVGAKETGALAYYAQNLVVVNLDGVVNHDAYEALKEHRLLAYARSVNMKYVIVWGGRGSIPLGALSLEQNLEFESQGRPWQVYRLLPL